MTKAAIIGTNFFPPLILYWYKQFKEIWYDEIDRVYFAISEPVHTSVADPLISFLRNDPKIRIKWTHKSWPDSVTNLCDKLDEDLFFIPHDDTFILEPGVITRNFDIAANGKVVTPIHNHYHPPYLIDELMMSKWPDQLPWIDPVTQSPGFSFFCNFFFISRENYLKTSRNMRSWSVDLGQPCEILGHTPRIHSMFSDVQFYFGLELLKAGVKFEIIKKNELPDIFKEGNPLDALKRHFNNNSGFYSEEWLHLQSIGFNVTGMYFDPMDRERIQAGRDEPLLPLYTNYPLSSDVTTVYTYIMRTALMLEWLSIKPPEALESYYEYMRQETEEMIEYFGLNKIMVLEFKTLFNKLFNKGKYAI